MVDAGDPGNVWLTHFVELYKTEYRTVSPTRKANIILNEILAPINQQGRRFVKLELYDGLRAIWTWILDPNPRTKIATKLRDMNKTPTADYTQEAAPPLVVPLPISSHDIASLQEPLILFDDALLRDVVVLLAAASRHLVCLSLSFFCRFFIDSIPLIVVHDPWLQFTFLIPATWLILRLPELSCDNCLRAGSEGEVDGIMW